MMARLTWTLFMLMVLLFATLATGISVTNSGSLQADDDDGGVHDDGGDAAFQQEEEQEDADASAEEAASRAFDDAVAADDLDDSDLQPASRHVPPPHRIVRKNAVDDDDRFAETPTAAAPTTETLDNPLETLQGEECLVYNGKDVYRINGNNNQLFPVVKIATEHLADPGAASASPRDKDNTMTVPTACAFAQMFQAASAAGVQLKIASGFRTIARQNYFWNCYQTKSCNGGNLAARPGTSNHGIGQALDLNANCGKQSGNSPPAECAKSPAYTWLAANGARFGFQRAVQSEPWHWEYKGAQASKTAYT